MVEKRQEIYDEYFKFAYKRQEIFFNKLQDKKRPYSDDEILDEYKFCNAYRASDRVSQYLIKNVIYSKENETEEDIIFRVILFKIFNKIETWQYLTQKLGKVSAKNFNFDVYDKLLEEYRKSQHAIYNSAYISCANKAYGYDLKHQNHLKLIQQMIFKDNITDKLLQAKKYSDIFYILKSYPLIGDFMAYQLMTDLNYTSIINFDEDDFTIAGPGAIRGINKCFKNKDKESYEHFIMYVVEHQDQEFKRLGLNFKNLFGRKLHAIDCQNIFCELDKYCRVAHPELKSNRIKIKAKYAQNSKKIEYFYPPKWGINKNIEKYIKTIE